MPWAPPPTSADYTALWVVQYRAYCTIFDSILGEKKLIYVNTVQEESQLMLIGRVLSEL